MALTLRSGLLIVWLHVTPCLFTTLGCPDRNPDSAIGPPQPDDAGFYLTVSGNPESYQPGELYTISLKGDKTLSTEKRFTEFVLTVEPDSEGKQAKSGGHFHLLGDVLTRFSDECTNTVTQATEVEKSEIQVLWTAPPPNSGCVTFTASVLQSPNVWSIDSDRLTVRLCEHQPVQHNVDEDINEPCCACEEAKYEVTFEGLWSKKTHPKDFPSSNWLLHFSDIIGASHSADYRVWQYNGYASKGLAQVAKFGSPRILESELKEKSEHIRTIIKARGLWYPNVNGKTFAVFRTDKVNHLVSLVSMLGPSPDWIIGVSGLELCLTNCSWVDQKELLLYPWDAGVDSGVSYESPDEPTIPQQPITRITSQNPDDPRQPFYNASGTPIQPLARLTVTRQRLYRKSCGQDKHDDGYDEEFGDDENDAYSIFEDHSMPGCETTEWTRWSSCSVTCGKGLSMRTREFKSPEKASMIGCDRQLIQKEMCSSEVRACQNNRFYIHAPDDFLPDDMCATTEWSTWSPCSTTCGKGFRSRTRRFYNRMGRKKCPHVDTIEKEMCAGEVEDCPEHSQGDEAARLASDPRCAVTDWSEWSPCSVSCGTGLKVRTRLYKVPPQQLANAECHLQLMEKSSCEGEIMPKCEFSVDDAKFICGLQQEVGPCRGHVERWYFDAESAVCRKFNYGGCRGNSNNFDSLEDCQKLCQKVANLVKRSRGVQSDETKKMFMETSKGNEVESVMPRQQATMVQQHPLVEERNEMDVQERIMSDIEPEIDCVVTAWSPWSDCDKTCGRGGFRHKFRRVKRFPSNGGQGCPRKMERKQKCRLPPCPHECLLSEWGPWSPCSQSCGQEGVQQRKRQILIKPSLFNHDYCKPLLEKRVCLLAPCL